MMELIDEADGVAAHRGPRAVGQAAGIAALDQHRPAGRTIQQPGDMQKRGLSDTGRRHQRDDLAGPQRQIEPRSTARSPASLL